MFEFVTVVLFLWLLSKVVSLTLRLTWGAAKIIAGVLTAVALPVLVLCLLFAGSLAMLVPLALLGIAFAVVKACVD